MTNRLAHLLEEKRHLTSDGATGTNLIARGLPRGMTAEEWVLENPEAILSLHKDFVDAGSDIILTSTFGGSEIRLSRSGLRDKHQEVNRKAVELARQAAKNHQVLIAGSIGPLGEMMKPLGTLDEDTAERNYRQQAQTLSESGVDLLLIETQFDISEATIAVKAARSISYLPVICSFSFDRGTKTMMGVSPSKFAEAIAPLGVTALGINCGKSLEDNLNALKELASVTQLPIWFKPNAGLPTMDAEGNASYNVDPIEMSSHVSGWLANGASIIGGCCGTSPEHISEIHKALLIEDNQ
ncbi:MAG: homocysteine S-methyltransferase family protein [Chloroflexi bacterium]|nr:homocysteine S-methyltransferase family protein [Chloroflexota bacterium]